MRMKRLLSLFVLLTLGTGALALDTRREVRIGVLRGEFEEQSYLTNALAAELRSRGLDAFDARRTHLELLEDGAADADYYVEIVGGAPNSTEYGGLDVGGSHAAVSLGVFVARFAAEVRIYDGQSYETLTSQDLTKRSTAVLPAGVGVGGRALFAWIAMPFIERAQWRNLSRAAARDVAAVIVDFVQGR